jgi:crossover junction endodeoxyribonuclease RuvC
MKILGVDPGTATTGFGVIEKNGSTLKFVDAGVITTMPEMSMPNRLAIIHEELGQLITEHHPQVVAVELLYFATNVTTAITVGQARGVILLSAAEAGLSVAEYTPLQVKQAVTGYGKADKKQVQEMVKMMLKLSSIPKPDDAADGLAIAITHANQLVGAPS